jgi:hypothetical protein
LQNIVVDRYPSEMPRWGGYIEPEDHSWIVYLDKKGTPEIYWPSRDESGGVIGEGISLL